MYDLSSELIMLDYQPEFAKLHPRGSRSLGLGLKGASLLDSLGHLFVYIHMAWETGILNTVHSCRRRGVTRAQLLDVLHGRSTDRWSAWGRECLSRGVE